MSWKTTGLSFSALMCASVLAGQAYGQSAPVRPAQSAPVWFKVPEWKSANGQIIVRPRGRLVHDFYKIDTNLGGTANDYEVSTDSLRAVRFGIDGQLSSKVRFRADANLTDSQVNWVDVYIGYTGAKYEAYIGQQRLATTFETLGPDVGYPTPETALVNTAFGQSARNFGIMGRVKGPKWQVVGALSSGNLNAGDIFGDDALQTAQLRATYAVRNKDRDVIHVGASLRHRDARQGALLRYAIRPASINFGPRALDSGGQATADTTASLEGLIIKGPFQFVAEHQMLQAQTAGGTVNLSGSYGEATWWMTGESRRYVVGTGSVSQLRPKKTVPAGGIGAIGFFARAEQLDQQDPILGARAGRVEALSLGVAWLPDDFIMLRLVGSQASIDRPLSTQSGTARVLLARAQISF